MKKKTTKPFVPPKPNRVPKKHVASKARLKKTLSENLRVLLLDAKITQQELSKKTKILPSSISAYIWGAALPSLQHIVSLSRVFNVDMDDMLGQPIKPRKFAA